MPHPRNMPVRPPIICPEQQTGKMNGCHGKKMRPKKQVEAPTVMVSPKTKAAAEPAKPDSRYTDRKVQCPRTASTSGATVYRAYVFSIRWLKLSCRKAEANMAWLISSTHVGADRNKQEVQAGAPVVLPLNNLVIDLGQHVEVIFP
ncbi:MAG: hypothetical protein FRX49_07656 [Trebouxia sp. A1-2]|nr:MAG: hypothetical protein FRX49_07656 [Trebouxia sp. A1-2]